MKIKNLVAMAILIAMTYQVHAQVDAKKSDELISQKIKAMYPNTAISKVRPSVIAGLYEVEMGQNIAYTGRFQLSSATGVNE